MRPHGLDDNISWNVATFYSTRIGGWCENWFTVYVGRKLPDGAELLLERRTNQALLDIIEGLNEKGIKENEAIDAVRPSSSTCPSTSTVASSSPGPYRRDSSARRSATGFKRCGTSDARTRFGRTLIGKI
jgi:hypothetical protein